MYGAPPQPSPAELAKARLAAEKTLYNAALSVVLLHTAPYLFDYLGKLFA